MYPYIYSSLPVLPYFFLCPVHFPSASCLSLSCPYHVRVCRGTIGVLWRGEGEFYESEFSRAVFSTYFVPLAARSLCIVNVKRRHYCGICNERTDMFHVVLFPDSLLSHLTASQLGSRRSALGMRMC